VAAVLLFVHVRVFLMVAAFAAVSVGSSAGEPHIGRAEASERP
jgi:hypothetical protein